MSKLIPASVIAGALVLAPLNSHAAGASDNQTKMAPLHYLLGTWHCHWQSGTQSEDEDQVFESTFGGAWLAEKEIVDVDGQSFVRSLHYTGYDPQLNVYVHVGPDANGNYELAKSPDLVTWTSTDGDFIHHKVSDTERRMNENDGGNHVSMKCLKSSSS